MVLGLQIKAFWKNDQKFKNHRCGRDSGPGTPHLPERYGRTEGLIQQNICAGRFPTDNPVTFPHSNTQPCNIYIRWRVNGAACAMTL